MSEIEGDGSLAGRIKAYVQSTDHVSFAELGNHFADEFYNEADRSHVLEVAHNVILWAGMSEAASDAVRELLRTGAIRIHPSSVLVYACDGRILNFPIAKRPSKKGYKDPHWLPVTLRPAAKVMT